MSVQCRARAPHDGTQCLLAAGHVGMHEARACDGGPVIAAWWSREDQSEPAGELTFDELLEYLVDLAMLANAEGFLRFGTFITTAAAALDNRRQHYARRYEPASTLRVVPLRRST